MKDKSLSLPLPSPLERLPLEVLEAICDCIAGCARHRQSLFHFSLVSKRCCSATARQRFGHLHIPIRGLGRLPHDVERYSHMLGVGRRARYVRALKISGYVPLTAREAEDQEKALEEANMDSSLESDVDEGVEGDSDAWHYLLRPPKHQEMVWRTSYAQLSDDGRKDLDAAWLPLAKFIPQLSGLQDLVYDNGHHLPPPCILAALLQHLPATRLHIPNLNLRSIVQSIWGQQNIHPDDIALVTSPNLYSITVPYAEPLAGSVSYFEEAARNMIEDWTPNLRHANMVADHAVEPLEHPGVSHPLQGVFPRKPVFPSKPSSDETSKGSLQSLVLGPSGDDLLQNWGKCTAFDRLQHFAMWEQVSLGQLRQLAGMGFDCLRSLRLNVRSPEDPDDPENPFMDDATCQLLQALNPLEKLWLEGFVGKHTFSTIIARHASTLRKLMFLPHRNPYAQAEWFSVDSNRVQELTQHCTKLEELKLLVPRTQGNGSEVALYRALGKLTRLKRLSLHLDCWYERHGDEEPDGQVDRIRGVLINAAVDSLLAQSIFRLVDQKNGNLEHLELQVEGARQTALAWDSNGLHTLIASMAQEWVVKRVVARGEVIAKEVDVNERIQALMWWKGSADFTKSKYLPPYVEAWQSLWGEKGEWWNNWSSFPLAEG